MNIVYQSSLLAQLPTRINISMCEAFLSSTKNFLKSACNQYLTHSGEMFRCSVVWCEEKRRTASLVLVYLERVEVNLPDAG